MGLPRVSLAALVTLHDLLLAQGFRRSFSDDRTVIELLPTIPDSPSESRQLSMPLDTPKLRGLSQTEREAVIVALTGLLLEAAADHAEGETDDARV